MIGLAREFVALPAVVAFVAFTLAACGGETKEEKDGGADGWKAEVVTVSDGSAEVGFEGAAEGDKYVLMPLSLGDPANVEGGSDETFTFSLASSFVGGALQTAAPINSKTTMSLSEYDHGKRTLLNRFDPSKGANQGEWFWQLARRLDEEQGSQELLGAEAADSIELGFRRMTSTSRGGLERLAAAASGTCPTAGGKVIVPNIDAPAEASEESIPDGGVVSTDDYCIVYVSDPVTGGTKAEIEDSIKEIVRRYKSDIYKDDFAATASYTFKPVFVVIDFDPEAELWPSDENLQVAGVFLDYLSTAAKMPMLYMASDISKVSKFKDKDLDEAKSKLIWHGTLAHEVQHAIINYFRVRVGGGDDEVPSIDEGLAHYMEDLFGYGAENFSDYAGAYMQNWASNNPPIHASDSGDITRGGAQAFLYYLASQKGGVEYTDGVVSGGTGLDLIVDLVKSSSGKRGPANLSAQFGSDWLATVANFYGALLLDGTDNADTSLEVAAPQTINDLNGGTNKSFGMRFNGYLPDFDANKAVTETTDQTTELEMTYYGTQPVIYTVKDPASKVTFTTTQDAANTAVIKVRIK